MVSINHLSDELLVEILTHSLVFTSLFNPGLLLGHVSSWSRALLHKKSIILVCKRWRNIATPFLYRQVVLRRPGQLSSLLHTLVELPYGEYVREITIPDSCYVPDETTDLFLKNLEWLLQRCSKAHILNIRPFRPLPIAADDYPKFFPYHFTKLTLDFGFDPVYWVLLSHDLPSTLKSLSITLCPSNSFWTHKHFPVLEELRFTHQNIGSIYHTPFEWTFAALHSLTVVIVEPGVDLRLSVMPFVKKHGEMLKHLSIHYHLADTTLMAMASVLPFCPNLEHLAVNAFCVLPVKPHDFAPNLKTLDIFSYDVEWHNARDELIDQIPHYPSLKLIRFFSEFRVSNFFDPLPSYADPLQVLKEALTWLNPNVDLRVDTVFEKLVMENEGGLDKVCVYVVHPPSQYHPLADKWGAAVSAGEADEAAYEEEEASGSESEMSETSCDSACSLACFLDEDERFL